VEATSSSGFLIGISGDAFQIAGVAAFSVKSVLRSTCAWLILATCLPAATIKFQRFEGDGFDDWVVSGSAFGIAPLAGKTNEMKASITGYANDSLAASTHGGPQAKGTLTSPEFTITEKFITFLICGGSDPQKTAAQLIIDGKIVRSASGTQSMRCQAALWDVTELIGQKAHITLMDNGSDEWDIIGVDQIIFADDGVQNFATSTRNGQPFIEGLEISADVAGVSIPSNSKLKIEATAADSGLTSPTAITLDEQGRVYVAETHRFRTGGVEDDREHLYWYLDDLAAKHVRDRSALFEKWRDKVPMENYTKNSELIRSFYDSDGDGSFDEKKIFADNFNGMLDGTAAGVFAYEGTLFFGCIPKIYALRDTTCDGVADERKVVEEDFGVRISFSGHDLNGFVLGPDGRLYGTIGDRGLNLVTKSGTHYELPNEGCAFRFNPDGTDFEIFHTGLRNPKEISFDAFGNAFTVDNNSDQGDKARIVYLVEGGDTGWQMEHQAMHSFHHEIGLEQRPPSRWMDEKMWELENPSQPAFMLPPTAHLSNGPSGLTYCPGPGFLSTETGRFLICDYRGGSANSGIWSFEMKPKGAGMMLNDAREFVWGIAATDVEYDWSGRVLISDFITGWVSHPDGRLFSLAATNQTRLTPDAAKTPQLIREGFDQRGSDELVSLLSHPDFRVRLRAQLALTRKPDALQKFSAATATTSALPTRIHAIWGLGILSRIGCAPLPNKLPSMVQSPADRAQADAKLVSLLGDPNEEIRCQVLRALATAPAASRNFPLAALLADPSLRIRFFAATLAGKRKLAENFTSICKLLQENDNRDVYLRHAGAFALQNIATDANQLSALASHESAAVRLAAVIALRRLKSPEIVNFISDADLKVADEAIRAIVDNDMQAQRPAVAALLDHLNSRSWTPFMLRRLIHNAFRMGTAESASRVLTFIANPKNPEIERKEALRLISIWNEPPPADQLTGHFRPLPARDPAVIQQVLANALPELLKQDGFVLASGLSLIGQYHVSVATLNEDSLAIFVHNEKLPANARANALRLYIERKPDGLLAMLAKLALNSPEELAVAALSNLARLSPADAIATLEAAVQSASPSMVQKAWQVLASVPSSQADELIIKALQTLSARQGIAAYAIELTATAKSRSSAPVAAALAAFEKSLTELADPLAKWNIALEGGDAAAGAAIYGSHPAAACMRCHRAEEGHSAGGAAAPNLYGIATRHADRRYFLESMVMPSAIIAEGYGATALQFKNGASLSGNLLSETAEHLDLAANGKNLRVKRSDVATITPPVSPMPSMVGLLQAPEIRDVIAWLASLSKTDDKPAAIATPELLDPTTLVTAMSNPVPTPAATVSNTTAADPAFLKIGQQQFMVCGACHGQAGEGTAVAPPLAGSEWVNGPTENLIRIQLRGLQGAIKVKGQEYNMPGGMAALAYQTDDQIAAVLSYVRSSFGNSATAVNPAEVTALRSEVGKPQMTASMLIPPVAPTSVATAISPLAKLVSTKYDKLPKEASFTAATAVLLGLILAVIVLPILKNMLKRHDS
jgi:quinoprotein glucose dehydrogenase